MRVRLVRLAVLCAAVMAFAAPLFAQSYTGRIDVTVADTTGAILPGVTVDAHRAAERNGGHRREG